MWFPEFAKEVCLKWKIGGGQVIGVFLDAEEEVCILGQV